MKKNENIPLNYKEKNNAKISLYVSVGVLAVLFIIFNQIDYQLIRKPAAQAQKAAAQEQKKKEEEEQAAAEVQVSTATVLAVGDNLVQPSLLQSGEYESGAWNYDHVYSGLQSMISAADVAIVNQETPFTTDHDAVSGSTPYATPTEIGDALVAAGFDVVTSATDLMDDSGSDLVSQTLSYWQSSHPETLLAGLYSSKEEAAQIQTLEVNGIKIAFLDYTFPTLGSSDNSGSTDEDSESTEDSSESTTSAADTYVVNTFDTQAVAAAIQAAKNAADCVIFSANWGKAEEPMPTEYEKQWANFLMEQGVDVVIGTHPNVLQPYGYLSDDAGHNMLIYYSLGNFVSGAETLKQLLGGMAGFTIQKTVTGDQVDIEITNASLTPLVMHYSYDNGEYQPYLLSDYTEELASQHSMQEVLGDEFSLANLQTKYDEIMSMKVTPSTGSTLLDASFDSEGNMYDSSGNYIEDTDSITSVDYYQNLSTDH